MEHVFVVYGISALLMILGFIALLTQKVYIDSNTNQPTEIEIPVMGKMRMKTNVPALVFVFLGGLLLLYSFNKAFPPKPVAWTIMGSFKNPEGDSTKIEWTKGQLALIPNNSVIPSISDKGIFTITATIDEGKEFEEVFQCLVFSHPDANACIIPAAEYKRYEDKQQTLIESATPNFRKFKPISIELISSKIH